MARKQVAYKEPADYFNADMKKAAADWDKQHADKKGKKPDTVKRSGNKGATKKK